MASLVLYVTGWNIIPCVLVASFQWDSTQIFSLELQKPTRYERKIFESAVKAEQNK